MFVGKDFTPALIDEVQKDSPAEVAGLMKNDVILEIDNNKVESILMFQNLLQCQHLNILILKFQDMIKKYYLK